MNTQVEKLRKDGVVVLHVGIENTADLRSQLDEEVKSFPEFKQGAKLEHMVMGGFSAFGNPASFHNNTVRDLRQLVYNNVKPFFAIYESDREKPRSFEQIVDRLMIRPSGKKPTAESWHRDVCPETYDGDTIFGGWLNLDDEPQYFTCCPGSHIEDTTGENKGFALIKKEDKAFWKARSVTIEIPPGHLIIFNENIVHTVLSKAFKHTVYRLFMGWRLTYSIFSLLRDQEEKFEKQGVMQLKSHQMPRVYPKLYWVNWKSKLEPFRKTFRKRCRIKLRCKKEGKKYYLPHELNSHMKSLREYGLKMYKPYTKQELNMHKPHAF